MSKSSEKYWIMGIIKVSEYNKIEMQLYNEKVAFFSFRNKNGSLKKSGWVVMGRKRAVYGKTQKEALNLWNN